MKLETAYFIETGGFLVLMNDTYRANFILRPKIGSGYSVGASSRSMYKKKNAIATAGKIQPIV